MVQRYYTLDNGTRHYMVEISAKDREICVGRLRLDIDEAENSMKPKNYEHILDVSNFDKVMLGNDPFIKHTKKFPTKGNSILVKGTSTKYLFIGSNVISFETPQGDVIYKFVSPIGNSGVPYPYALGKKFVYLLIENVYIPYSAFVNKKRDVNWDPYHEYYNHSGRTANAKSAAKKLRVKQWSDLYIRRLHKGKRSRK